MEYLKLKKPYPLWKVEYEQIPHKEVEHTDIYRIYVKIAKDANYMCLYVANSLPRAQIALQKLQDIFDTQVINMLVNEYYYPMFEIHNQIYKTLYVFPNQSCICGEDIPGNHRYGEYSVEATKFDYVQDYVFFYEQGTCLVKCNQLFIDGELKYNSKELKQLCDDIGQDFNNLDLYPEKLIKHISGIYPELTQYVCGGYFTNIR